MFNIGSLITPPNFYNEKYYSGTGWGTPPLRTSGMTSNFRNADGQKLHIHLTHRRQSAVQCASGVAKIVSPSKGHAMNPRKWNIFALPDSPFVLPSSPLPLSCFCRDMLGACSANVCLFVFGMTAHAWGRALPNSA